jgi:exodeoxyribonuclease VII large subunit
MAEIARPRGAETLSVTQLTRYLKYLVESDELMSALSVRGEICELSRSAAGHLYMAIKDDGAQISCVMFRREAMRQRDETDELRKGAAVVVHGYLTLYEPRTQCQVYVERIVLEGEGAHQRRFEALKAKLEGEGLFAPERKRDLPTFPRKIALITSIGSQAYHDVLHRLRTQCPFVTVVEAGTSVQGDRAPGEVVMALDLVNRLTDADVILLVRGGGSPEDLAAFNDERIARAIYASRIPVITGIGHEMDYSIADYVADVRAATPSLAAATAVPDLRALVEGSRELHSAARLAMAEHVRRARTSWVEVNRSLLRASPDNRVRDRRQRFDELMRAGERAMAVRLGSDRAGLDSLKAQLATLDPLAILARGYAVLTDRETGRVVSSTSTVRVGDHLRAHVADGTIDVSVEGR